MITCSRAGKAGMAVLSVLALSTLIVSTLLVRQTTHAASVVTINGATSHQTIDGFGFSQAFGPAKSLQTMSSSSQRQQILDLLFSPTITNQ